MNRRRSTVGSHLAALAISLALASMAAPAVADETSPQELLKERRLKLVGTTWVLLDESKLQARFKDLRALSRRIGEGMEHQSYLQQGSQRRREISQQLRAEREQLGVQLQLVSQELNRLGPNVGIPAAELQREHLAQTNNQIVGRLRQLDEQIRTLDGGFGDEEEKDQRLQVHREVAQSREAYIEGILELRKLADEIAAQYATLDKDASVRAAMEATPARSKVKTKLGPSREFLATLKLIERLEGSISSDTVELHRENGVDHIDTFINGKTRVRMVFDTGAGPTLLSAKLAADLKLKPTGETLRCRTADGSEIDARVMIIESIRVGKSTVKDLECAVMPAEKGEIEPLLGQSFHRHFTYRYTPGTGRLGISRVGAPGVEARPSTAARSKGATSRSTRPTSKARRGILRSRPADDFSAPGIGLEGEEPPGLAEPAPN